MQLTVFGAGVVGVTTAWFLRQAGHEVRVIERRKQAGLETSFANAGQISAHLADPWANPSTLRDVWTWLFRDDTPLVFRPKADIHQWLWLLKFLKECPADRYKRNLVHLANLGVYSRGTLQALRSATGLRYDERERGILLFFVDQAKLDGAAAAARDLARYGLRREVFSVEQCLDVEPSLASIRGDLKGGIYSRYDETGDAFKFTQGLARLASDAGVSFEYETAVEKLHVKGGRIQSASVTRPDGRKEQLASDQFVLCLGTASAAFARKLGFSLPIYPVKGYSVTFPVRKGAQALAMGLTDAAHKMAFSRLGERVRATAIAEIAGYDLSIDRKRCGQIEANARRLFGQSLDYAQAEHWAGLRPMTPSNLPVIGRSARYANLLINAGHGTIGWTQSCGSARAISEIVAGRRPECDFPFIGLNQ
jgi:D-amino-acid dehydrogenase